MRFLAAITGLLGLVSAAAADPAPAFTPLSAVLRDGPAAFRAPVRAQGVVTYCDPTRRCLALQDGDAGVVVRIPLDTPPLRPGDRAEVRAAVLGHQYLDATEARAVGDGPLPEPLAVTGAELAAGRGMSRRVAVSGVVRTAAVEGDHAILQLMADRRPVRVFVRDLPAVPVLWDRYVDAEVRAVGVSGPAVDEAGLRVEGIKLLVQSPDDLLVTRPAPDSPFGLPPTAVADVPEWGPHRVLVTGRAAGPVADGVLALEADGRTVRVAVPAGLSARAGERFDAAGFPDRRDGLPFLAAARVRGYAPARGATPTDPSGLLPILQSVADLRRLTPAEASRGYPVRLRATVTYHDAAEGDLFVHDGEAGLFVFRPAGASVPPGTIVYIEGYSDPGEFAPSVRATAVTPDREGRLPPARPLDYARTVGGREDGQWVEIDAVVRGAGRDDGGGYLMLRYGPVTARARVAGTDPAGLGRLFGAGVRVRAVCGSQFNPRRQWEGPLFYVPSADAIQVVRPAATDRTALPVRTVESLSRFDPDRGPGEPVRVGGRLISRRDQAAQVQDATGGIGVDLQPRQPGAVGDRVEVHGFLVRRGSGWALEDGLVRVVDAPSDAPGPADVTPAEVAAGGYGATLVRLDGVLVDQLRGGDESLVLILRSADPAPVFFTAVLPPDRLGGPPPDLRPGSLLRVTGACVMPAERLMISAFRVHLRAPADIEVVHQPSWWTPRKAVAAAALVALVAVLALAWVLTLRRRVRGQTEQIRRRLEREAHLEARYRDLFESASDAVFTLDAAGAVTGINPAGARLTGLAVGHSFLDAAAPGSAADARELVACRAPLSREVELRNGALLEVSARPVTDGVVSVGVQAIGRDLTHRRRLEVELRQAQKMEAVGRLAGGIAHDFNNLLTVINGNAEVLRARADADGLAAEIVRAGEQAAALTRQLLAFSRKGVVAPRVLCPNATVAGLQPMLARLVGEPVRVATDLDETAGCVRVDPGQLEQVLMNLAVNARDAMPHGGTLTIRTRSRPRHVRIEVIDTGTGMDPATRARAFEPFFTTKPAGEGTGLGLATVKNIVDQAGGTVGVQSEPGRGATFVIELPVAGDPPASPPPPPPAPVPAANKEVILLVEDEPAVQLLERRVLEMGKYEVLVASCGEEALNLLDGHAGKIDLLVTDVVMPGMSGRELAEAVARRRPGLPALFLSGYTPDEVLRQGVRAEGTHFLQKPFTPSSLLGKVREVLSQA